MNLAELRYEVDPGCWYAHRRTDSPRQHELCTSPTSPPAPWKSSPPGNRTPPVPTEQTGKETVTSQSITGEPTVIDLTTEELVKLNYAGWMNTLQDLGLGEEYIQRLEELVANWMGQQKRRELRRLARERSHQNLETAQDELIEEWITDQDCHRLAQLIKEREFTQPRIPVCYAVSDARRTIESTLRFIRNMRAMTKEEIAAGDQELQENQDEYDYLSALGMLEEPGDSSG